MRTTLDLIKELHTERDYSAVVALAVGFEHHTKFIFGEETERDALSHLNELVQQGGEPIGF